MSYVQKVVIGDATLYQGDCAELLPTLGRFDTVITDPPYGIGMDGGNVGYKGANNFAKLDWDKETPSAILMALVVDAGDKAILWGGNYFDLPPTRCYLIWDKGAGFKGRTYAEAELAWTNFDANVRIFTHDPLARGDYKGKSHPTMKPTALMAWCIEQAGNPENIIDPFMGSASTGVAAVQLGRKFTGIERDAGYFKIACQRIEQAYAQGQLFQPERAKQVQEALV